MAVSIRFGYVLMLIAQPLAIHYVFVFIPPFLQETETKKVYYQELTTYENEIMNIEVSDTS